MFKNKLSDKHLRSLVKALTWRITGTVTLISITYLATEDFDISLFLGGVDIISNIILYYLHERIWAFVDWGKTIATLMGFEDKKRSLTKTISWRILATPYLIIVFYFFTGKPVLATGIAVMDLMANLIEYYIHERIWNKIAWGKRVFK